MNLWNGVLDFLESVLTGFHDFVVPVAGDNAWGWAIIMLTVAVRVVLLPLAIKQINSMRAMQKLQPEIKKLQSKYKVDRSLMRTDPEKFRTQRTKQQEAMMGLYKEHGVNPAASCLPLLAQMPVFFALFVVLARGRVDELDGASFYLVSDLTQFAGEAGLGAYLLIAAMAGTTFLTQKQMMRTNPAAAEGPQKILLYVMPVMLLVFSVRMPVGVLLYWVTTNIFQATQQWFMLRDVKVPNAAAATDGKSDGKSGGETAAHNPSASSGTPGKGGASSGKGSATSGKGGASSGKGGASSGARSGDGGTTSSGNGRSSSPTTGGGGRKKGSGAGGSGGSGPARPSPGGRRSDHIPRRGGGRP